MKYKKAEPEGQFIRIDDFGNKTASWTKENKPGYYAAMMAWVAEGNEIEEVYNAEELAAKKLKEDEQALESQNQTLINYLDLSEKHVSNDPPYPINVAEWKTARNEWRIQLKANELTDIYKKPY